MQNSAAPINPFDAYYYEPNKPVDPSNYETLHTGNPAIDSLRLDRIIAKARDAVSGYNWDTETAIAIAEMYKAFLFLCKTYPQDVIVPPREVDEFWHLHILDTRNYLIDCEKIFGGYLHHFPYAGLPGTQISSEQEKIFSANTLQRIRQHFPQLLEEDPNEN